MSARASAFSRAVRVSLSVLLFGAALLASACTSGKAEDRVGPPAPPNLSTPESSVRTYLDWISYAYRISDSSVASRAYSPEEGVRVDSYIEYNRQEGRSIEQTLTAFDLGTVSVESTSAQVEARETWRYRYLSSRSGKPLGDWYQLSYDTVYSLVRSEGHWLVDAVKATPKGKVK